MGLLSCNLLSVGNHHRGSFALGKSICFGDHDTGNQAVAVVGLDVAHEKQFTPGFALFVQARIKIGGGLVGFVAVLLNFEVACVLVTVVFAGRTLVTGPRLNQRAGHAEMVTQKSFVLAGDGQHFVEEFYDRTMHHQPLTVLGAYRGLPDRVVHGHADKPAKQQIQLNSQEFRANAVKDLRQHGA